MMTKITPASTTPASTTPASKVVVVTGGSRGIGRAIAARFARQGDTVIILGRDQERLEQTAGKLGHNVAWQVADVAERASVSNAVDAIIQQHRQIDVLVNNAGFGGGILTTTPLDEADAIWNSVVDANLKGSFLMAVAVAPHLKRPGGRIVNISSIAALTGGSRPGGLAYAAAKAGIHGLTFALARELSPEGITVNALAPGLIEDTGFFGGRLPDERLEQVINQTPLGRTGKPDDIASVVQFLASEDASFVTGEVVGVNGGWLFGR